ncbi:hypothetical protein Cob_v002508 [Colletotrichum orbiculare MAFF 240422]|uniref:Uncharacterized protein n=1 Tax=Colletotrichum orbiculare (strain 104-T / ATCC 96160 / CBS 514.97 / LARS 414 / MAFF 240422) TaxID=1213857 RepID=N4VVE6_COLOR|nr:hypothetical protein Cob_v002508 [Colletotrichum orbiculare MAFF 240422]
MNEASSDPYMAFLSEMMTTRLMLEDNGNFDDKLDDKDDDKYDDKDDDKYDDEDDDKYDDDDGYGESNDMWQYRW